MNETDDTPKSQSEYDMHNIIGNNQATIIGYIDAITKASDCFKSLDGDSIDIIRMYVKSENRGMALQLYGPSAGIRNSACMINITFMEVSN